MTVSRFLRIFVLVAVASLVPCATPGSALLGETPELTIQAYTCKGGFTGFLFIGKGAGFAGIGSGNIYLHLETPSSSTSQVGFVIPNAGVLGFNGVRFLWDPSFGTTLANLSGRFCFKDQRTKRRFVEEIPFSKWNNTAQSSNIQSELPISKFSSAVRNGQAKLETISIVMRSSSTAQQSVTAGEFVIFTRDPSIPTLEPETDIGADGGCKLSRTCGFADWESLRERIKEQAKSKRSR